MALLNLYKMETNVIGSVNFNIGIWHCNAHLGHQAGSYAWGTHTMYLSQPLHYSGPTLSPQPPLAHLLICLTVPESTVGALNTGLRCWVVLTAAIRATGRRQVGR